MESLFDWLIGSGGAAWITIIIAIIGGIIAWSRWDRPKKVIIQEVSNTKLIGISSPQQSKLEVTYKDENNERHSVDRLIQKHVAIYNSGTKDIEEPIELSLSLTEVDSDTDVVGFFEFNLPDGFGVYKYEYNDDTLVGLQINFPYLNSYSQHSHVIEGYCLSENQIQIDLKNMPGKGWSAYFISSDETPAYIGEVPRIIDRIINTIGLLVFLVGIAFFLYSTIVVIINPSSMIFTRPTTEGIDIFLVKQREILEVFRDNGYLAYIYHNISNSPYGNYSGVFSGLFILVIGAFFWTLQLGKFLGKYIYGIQDKSEFQKVQ